MIRRLLLVALLLLAGACSSDDDDARATSRLDRADRRITRIIDATAEEVLPGRTGTRPEEDDARGGCHDVLGRPNGRASAGYTLRFPLRASDDTERLLQRVHAYWEARGFEPEIDRRRSQLPAVRAEFDEVRLGFEIITFNDLLVLEAGTNCLPD